MLTPTTPFWVCLPSKAKAPARGHHSCAQKARVPVWQAASGTAAVSLQQRQGSISWLPLRTLCCHLPGGGSLQLLAGESLCISSITPWHAASKAGGQAFLGMGGSGGLQAGASPTASLHCAAGRKQAGSCPVWACRAPICPPGCCSGHWAAQKQKSTVGRIPLLLPFPLGLCSGREACALGDADPLAEGGKCKTLERTLPRKSWRGRGPHAAGQSEMGCVAQTPPPTHTPDLSLPGLLWRSEVQEKRAEAAERGGRAI